MSLRPTYTSVHVYLRFSSDAQADGESFDRQRHAAEQKLAQLNLGDMPVHWLEDPGFSAFKGRHLSAGEMGRFLADIRAGKLRNGLFVCESVSRASRQGPFAAFTMLNELLEAGFTIWFLNQGEPFNKENKPQFIGVQLALLAELANEESKTKSYYAQAAWRGRRKSARDGTLMAFTGECPMWLEVVDGQYQLIPERVESIQKIYALALGGWGISRLVRYANMHKLPAPGKKGNWHLSLIKRVLTNRALIGEFQPYMDTAKGRTKEGNPIPNFYPAVLDPDTFYAVQRVRARASKFPKRRDANNFNYLMGIAKCVCGAAWRRMNKNSGAQAGYALYGCSNRARAASDCANVNARAFDLQFVGFACDHIPALLSSGIDPQKERRLSVEAQIEEARATKKRLVRFVEENSDLADDFADRLRDVGSRLRELELELSELESSEPPPVGFTFGEAVEVFIPAYLDVFEEGSEEWENAYRARALFRTRLIEAVGAVLVSADRRLVTLTLKNGATVVLEMDPKAKIGAAADDMSADELQVLEAERATQIARARRMHMTAALVE